MRRTARRILVLATSLAATGTLLAACGGANGTTAARSTTSTTSTTSTSSAAGASGDHTVGTSSPVTLVATTHGAIPGFGSPGGPQTGTVPGTWQGAPSILPVVSERPGWYEVRLAQRPNESRAWVLARDVSIAETPYRIVIDLASTHLTLYRHGHPVFSTQVGVGTAQYPTPTGRYFVALFARPPTPGYGAFVMVTSAHSDTITDWERSGDAIIAIHGPLGSDAAIGTTGARISHGCVRLHEPDLLRLRVVPAGSPVDIEAD